MPGIRTVRRDEHQDPRGRCGECYHCKMKYRETFFVGAMAIFALATFPIMLLNVAGGLIGGLWLIIVGKWGLVLLAFIAGFFGTWILGLFLLPSMIFALPLVWAAKHKYNFLVLVFGALASLWTYIVMTFWCTSAFLFVLSNFDGGSIWPYLLLGYAISAGPWTYMASQEKNDPQGNGGYSAAEHGNAFVCFGSVLMMILALLGKSPETIVLWFVIVMGIAWLSQSILVLIGIRRTNSSVPAEA